MCKINNKGYMLVEIILASVIAMVVAYFVIDLTIKLKNKNDDLIVKTLVYTDQAIIYNTIMDDIYNAGNDVNCDYIKEKITVDKENNVFKYGEFTNVISEYATIGDYTCEGEGISIKINIPMEVKQLPDDEFDVRIGDVSEYVEDVDLECSLSVNGTTIEVSSDVSDLTYYGWDPTYTGDNSTSKVISGVGIYMYYVKDRFGTEKSCGIEISSTTSELYCPMCEDYCYNPNNWFGGACYYNGCYPNGYCDTYAGYSSTRYVCASGYTKINDSYCYILK